MNHPKGDISNELTMGTFLTSLDNPGDWDLRTGEQIAQACEKA